jgi:hypothetical protein
VATPTPTPSVQDVLAREAAGRMWAAVGAAVAAIFTIGGSIGGMLLFRDFPPVFLIDALRDAAGEPMPGREGLRAAQVLFYDEHAAPLLAIAAVLAIGALALLLPLTYLYKAVKARRPQIPAVAMVMSVSGPVALALSEVILQAGIAWKAHDFAGSADHSSQAARDLLSSGIIVAGQVLRQAAVIALGFAFVLVSLNAMRVGLLTRFMGVLGIIVGALFVIPLGSQPVVQTFWLLALAALLAGRWPNAIPPAWAAGTAVPWPSSQDLQAVRDAASARSAGDEPQADDEPEGPDTPGRPHPSSKKKRRRKR